MANQPEDNQPTRTSEQEQQTATNNNSNLEPSSSADTILQQLPYTFTMKFKNEQLTKELQLNNERILKQRKKEFTTNLIYKLDTACYLVLLLLYFVDNSLILLFLRSFHQFMVGHPPTVFESNGSNSTPESFKKIVAQKVLGLSLVFNVGPMLTHLLVSCGDGLAEGYWFGYLSLNLIGERNFRGWVSKLCYLFMLDFSLIVLQFILFTVNFVITQDLLKGDAAVVNDDLSGENEQGMDEGIELEPVEAVEPVNEYDGYQGGIMLFEIDVAKIFKKVRSFNRIELLSNYRSEQRQSEHGEGNEQGDASSTTFGNFTMPGSFDQLRRFTDVNSLV